MQVKIVIHDIYNDVFFDPHGINNHTIEFIQTNEEQLLDFKSYLSKYLSRNIGQINKYRHFRIYKVNDKVMISRKKDAIETEWVKCQ